MPNSVASVRCFGESPPSASAIAWCGTTAWTIPERVKPRIRGQRISQNILKAIKRACPILVRTAMVVPFHHHSIYLPVKLQAPRASFRQQAFEQQHRIGSGYHGGATIACARHCDEGWSASPNCVSLMHSNSCRYAFACWKRADNWLSQPDYSTHEDPIAV